MVGYPYHYNQQVPRSSTCGGLCCTDLGSTIGLTGQVLLFGGSGLLCALIGMAILRGGRAQRWAGGCLAVSCLIVLALFPAPIVLILEVTEAAAASTAG